MFNDLKLSIISKLIYKFNKITNNIATADSERLKKMQRAKIIKTFQRKIFPPSFRDLYYHK